MNSYSRSCGLAAARSRRFNAHLITAVIVGAALLCVAGAGPAWADSRAPMTVDGITRAYEKAVAHAEDDTVIETRASAEVVGVPSDPSRGVTIGSGADTVRVVPDTRAAAAARTFAGDGRGLYRGADARTTTVVERVGMGVRIATVSSDDGDDTQRFSYRLGLPDAANAYLTAEGAVRIVRADGRALVTIATPWARDAVGRSLPTSFSLEGSTLVQTVNTRGARLPVVADPRIENTGFLGLTGDFNVNIDQAHARNNCLTLEIRLLPPPASLPDWDDGDGNHCVHPS